MRDHRVYLDQNLEAISQLVVSGSTAHYLSRVLRFRVGQVFTVFNGQGGQFPATVLAANKNQLTIELGSHQDVSRQSPLRLVLAQAVAKGDRMDQVMQKATELGVTGIVPLLTDHGVVKVSAERADKRRAHWEKIIISACEQCGRNFLPKLHDICSFDHWLDALDKDSVRLVPDPGADASLTAMPALQDDQKIVVLIGPEGGLSERELSVCELHGFQRAHIGPRILRTETAGLAALAIIQAIRGDL